ncbi:hypothetical protein P170DRAFT_481384 [Aspergillus steynii IBT 23096]|uniref:CCHC-type domain-containing protein n=1 Tax=Aspergillus steynii IBT 23096 TaxID=1392250 RepID=A0A2I2FS52_9EURO|nr:uncharacterized protein P170DRAFT_481384 [Aspergillus steynii IBT 23096]PLB43436.1 hypothetical protein P170DRAFT_481384 [Aspergillus steynii IBT 23096]
MPKDKHTCFVCGFRSHVKRDCPVLRSNKPYQRLLRRRPRPRTLSQATKTETKKARSAAASLPPAVGKPSSTEKAKVKWTSCYI